MDEKPKSRRLLFLLLAAVALAALISVAIFMPAYDVPRPYSAHQ